MPVESYTVTQYTVTCDKCGKTEVCPDGNAESVNNKRQAIKWANMHNTKIGILCENCFKKQRRFKTMADYIERQRLKDAILADCQHLSCFDESFFDMVMNVVYEIPSANVREDVQAEWLDTGDHTQVRYCSQCGVAFDLYAYCKADYNFCPSCGARMVNKP